MDNLSKRLEQCRKTGRKGLGVSDLAISGLECALEFQGLEIIEFDRTPISDLTPLSELRQLRHYARPD